MSIAKKPALKTTKTADEFIAAAPDAAADKQKPRGVIQGKKRQITLGISPALLERVDELAAQLGQTRASVINMAIYRAVESGLPEQQ